MSFPSFPYGVLADLVLELLSVLLEVLQREQRDGGGLVGGATQSGQRAKHLTVREGRRFQVQRLRLLVQLRVDALQIRV